MTEYYEVPPYDAGELDTLDVTTHPHDPYLMTAAGRPIPTDISGSSGYPGGTPLGVFQGPGPSSTVVHSGAAWIAAQAAAAQAVASQAAANQAVVSSAMHTYATEATQAISATRAAEAAAAHRHSITTPRHSEVISAPSNFGGAKAEEEADQSIYFEASLEVGHPDTSLTELSSVIHNPRKFIGTFRRSHGYDDLTEWINTVGLYGPLSVPVAVVAPINSDVVDASMYSLDHFANVPNDLFGLTFKTRGMLFDTGSPHTLFENPLVF